jgi:hypothetical protein
MKGGTMIGVYMQSSSMTVEESQEAFEALESKLMPIAQELGVEISPPQFVEMIAYEVA